MTSYPTDGQAEIITYCSSLIAGSPWRKYKFKLNVKIQKDNYFTLSKIVLAFRTNSIKNIKIKLSLKDNLKLRLDNLLLEKELEFPSQLLLDLSFDKEFVRNSAIIESAKIPKIKTKFGSYIYSESVKDSTQTIEINDTSLNNSLKKKNIVTQFSISDRARGTQKIIIFETIDKKLGQKFKISLCLVQKDPSQVVQPIIYKVAMCDKDENVIQDIKFNNPLFSISFEENYEYLLKTGIWYYSVLTLHNISPDEFNLKLSINNRHGSLDDSVIYNIDTEEEGAKIIGGIFKFPISSLSFSFTGKISMLSLITGNYDLIAPGQKKLGQGELGGCILGLSYDKILLQKNINLEAEKKKNSRCFVCSFEYIDNLANKNVLLDENIDSPKIEPAFPKKKIKYWDEKMCSTSCSSSQATNKIVYLL